MDLKMLNKYNIPKKVNTIYMCMNDDVLTALCWS